MNIQIKQFQTGPTGTTCTGAPQTPATALMTNVIFGWTIPLNVSRKKSWKYVLTPLNIRQAKTKKQFNRYNVHNKDFLFMFLSF